MLDFRALYLQATTDLTSSTSALRLDSNPPRLILITDGLLAMLVALGDPDYCPTSVRGARR